MRSIIGTHYTQSDRLDRDQNADFKAALETVDPLMHLWGLGYDVSGAKVVSR